MADDNTFLEGLLRSIQGGITEINQRMDKLERRLTASMHFEQHVLAHLTGINESQDEMKSDLRALRGEVADIKSRLEHVEAR